MKLNIWVSHKRSEEPLIEYTKLYILQRIPLIECTNSLMQREDIDRMFVHDGCIYNMHVMSSGPDSQYGSSVKKRKLSAPIQVLNIFPIDVGSLLLNLLPPQFVLADTKKFQNDIVGHGGGILGLFWSTVYVHVTANVRVSNFPAAFESISLL